MRLNSGSASMAEILKAKLAEAKERMIRENEKKKDKEKSFTIAENSNGTLKGELVTLTTSGVSELLNKESVQVTGQLNKDQVTFNHLNAEQRLAVTLGTSGKSFVLIGPAGSGKTTTQRVLLEELARSSKLGKIKEASKSLAVGLPSVLITSFTKVATRNIRDAAPSAFKSNCINIHKAIEFSPVAIQKEVIGENGERELVDSMAFRPARNRVNPLSSITHCIVEESGSVDTQLFLQLVDALPRNCIFIFLGDLNQIPPVYGAAILGFAISKLPVVELKTTYRQNVGPIKKLAMDVLVGSPLKAKYLEELAAESKPGAELILKPMTKKNNGITLNKGLGDYMKKEVLLGNFVPGESVFLCAVRKDRRDLHNLNEMNRHIAQALTEKNNFVTHEIKSRSAAGGTFYYAVGDLVFYEREYYQITEITENPTYSNLFGYDYKAASRTLDRWGNDKFHTEHDIDLNENSNEVDEAIRDALNVELEELENTKNCLSHHLTLVSFGQEPEDTYEIKIKTPGDINKIALGYAQTFHSAQGSEWKNVYLSSPHATGFMINREILYTAITRARQKLTVFFEDGTKPYNFSDATFIAGIKRQAIKGNKLSDKVKFFKELYKKMEYKHIPKLLDELNRSGTMSIEDYYSYTDNGELKIIL